MSQKVNTPATNIENKKNDSSELITEPNTTSESSPPENSESKKEVIAALREDLKTRPYVDVCKFIDGRSPISLAVQKKANTNEKSQIFFEKLIALHSRSDLGLFEVRLPASGKIAELVYEEQTGPLQDLNYVRLIYQSKAELEKNLKFAELIRLRSYFALTLARIALLKPQLIGEPEMLTLCEKFQKLDEKIDRQELNNLILNYMQRAQVNENDIKFNPEFAPNIKVQWFQDHFGYYEESYE